MKIGKVLLMLSAVALLFTANAQASLEVTGTANYSGQDYNLIYMDDGPFGPVTWLDYTRTYDEWQDQVNWASGLGGQLTVSLNPGYTSSIDWSTGWRLPKTVDGEFVFGYDGTTTAGFNITTSEMGYLFYEALGNKGYYDTSGTSPQPGWGLNNTGDFNNLQAYDYWSGTEYSPDPDLAWVFNFYHGNQLNVVKAYNFSLSYALAVRPGDVSAVPVPGTLLLLGTGLAGLGAFRQGRRRRLG